MSVNEQARGSVASRRDERRRKKGAWWIPVLLLGLLIAGVIAFAATRGSDDNSGNDTSAAQRSTGGGNGASQASQGAGGASSSGSLTAGRTDVLAAGGARDLSRYAGQNVRGRGVKVVSVVGNEVFWVGASAGNRVLVHMEARGESPFTVKAGDRVSFTGRMAPAGAGTAREFGVTKAEGATLLARQKQFVETDTSRVNLAK